MATTRLTLADDIALVETLRVAVPLRLADLLATPANLRRRRARVWTNEAARIVGERGDLLQFVTKRRRETGADLRVANVFEHLARGLAGAAVLDPGGVVFAGLHWCVDAGCARCNPPRPEPRMTTAEARAELERLDREYRQICGLPEWQPPTVVAVIPARLPKPRSPRPVETVRLPEVA